MTHSVNEVSQDTERETFEAWCKHLGQGYRLDRDEGTYISQVTCWAFTAWQARAAIAVQPPAASEIKTKQVWVAWTNTDLAEGRGHEIPLAVCETEGTARRLGAKGYVMGTQCLVTECTAILSGCHWLVPGRIIAPTMEDQRLSQLYADQRAAVERAKAAGLSVEDLKLLGAL